MNYEAKIKRIDLSLRTRFLDIYTTIYKIHQDYFEIYCENVGMDFPEFSKNFEHSIRVMGSPVTVVNKKPDNFVEIIPGISDQEIPKDFAGMSMTKLDLLNLLAGKFPKVYFYDLETTGGNEVTIKTASFREKTKDGESLRFLNDGDRKKIMEFLSKMNPEIVFKLFDEEKESYPGLQTHAFHNPVQYVYATSFRRDISPEFAQRDEALWFDNVEAIYEGKFRKENLYFYQPDDYSCYVDYSTFANIDIRNHLLLFPTVYITLPFEKDIPTWLGTMKVAPEEFLELIKRGRIKVVLTQPELRYQIDFFKEIYKANPNAIISRRALIALQQIDIIEIANNYIFNDPKVVKEMKPFCEAVCKGTKMSANLLYEMIAWPLKARRQSFESLHYSGLIGTPSFGVNQAVEKVISNAASRDMSFEFTVSSSAIHLSNALNATYFPYESGGFSDYHFANIMGGYLNFYRNATVTKLKSFVESREQINSGILPINPIDIFEINDYLPITELEAELSREVIYPNSKKLMEHLANLSPEQREKTISHYNEEVTKNISKKNGRTSTMDLGSNIFLDVLGTYTGFNALGTALSAVKIGGKKIGEKIPDLKNLKYKIEESFYEDPDKKNIHYLTRINRVARIKRF